MVGIDFSEGSTWKGLITLLISIGLFTLTPLQVEAIAALGVAIYSVLSIFLKDRVSWWPKKKEG